MSLLKSLWGSGSQEQDDAGSVKTEDELVEGTKKACDTTSVGSWVKGLGGKKAENVKPLSPA